jgi:uncharacterized protein YggE
VSKGIFVMANAVQFSPVVIQSPRFGQARKKADTGEFMMVQGVGTVAKTPDTMYIGMTISQNGETRDAVVTALDAKSIAMLTAIKALNKQGLQLKSQINVTPLQVWEQQVMVNKGFQGTFNLAVMQKGADLSDLKKTASELTDLAVSHDANFNGPNFSYSRIQEASTEALKVAAEHLTSQAKALAAAFGIRISEKPDQLVIGQPGAVNNNARHGGFAVLQSAGDSSGGGMHEDTIETSDIPISSPNVEARFKILA